jgi:hypothetical protein
MKEKNVSNELIINADLPEAFKQTSLSSLKS